MLSINNWSHFLLRLCLLRTPNIILIRMTAFNETNVLESALQGRADPSEVSDNVPDKMEDERDGPGSSYLLRL